MGVSAAGKSTFSRALAIKTSLPVTFMDSIMWKPNWVHLTEEEGSREVEKIALNTEWIIEGYVPKPARHLVFENADTIIYLDYPRLVATTRYIKRWWVHRKNPRPEIEGCPEKFSFSFLKLVWEKGEAVSLRKSLAEVKDQSKILKLKSSKAADAFLETL